MSLERGWVLGEEVKSGLGGEFGSREWDEFEELGESWYEDELKKEESNFGIPQPQQYHDVFSRVLRNFGLVDKHLE